MRQSAQELFERYQGNLYILAFNICKNTEDAKNVNRTFWRKNKISLEEYMDSLEFPTPESEELFETVMHLPEKYRIVVHLFYYEDCTVREIADILKLSESNVKVRLSRARSLLRETLQEEWENDK